MKKQFRLYHPGVDWFAAMVTDCPDSAADLKAPVTRNLDLSITTLESQLYLGHITGPCAYLPDRESALLFLDGRGVGQLYRLLLDRGYRRHGRDLYRPDCAPCQECQVLRVEIERFRPNRNQRRVFKKGREAFSYRVQAPEFTPEKLALYQRYLAFQHDRGPASPAPDGSQQAAGMNQHSYREFFVDSFLGNDTCELQLFTEGQLVGVAILDRAGDALSAVYFYFAPEVASLSPGTFAILLEIELAREWGLRWFYPGFFISGCPAMSYKQNFRPHELRVPGQPDWRSSPCTSQR